MIYLYLVIGGSVGTVARYGIGIWVQERFGPAFPWGTLVVNVTGSLLLGFMIRMLDGAAVSPETRLFWTVGFCGAFTTFSTFSLETIGLLESGAWGRAAAYVLGSVSLGLIAVGAGLAAGTLVSR